MSEHHTNPGNPSHKTVWERDTLERLAFATLAEQRTSRRWRIFFRFAWLSLVAALLWAVMHKGGVTGANPSQPHTAVVAIKGEIADGADASAEWVVTALRAAFEDEGSQAVVLQINSPGGSPVQAGIINDEIRRLKETPELFSGLFWSGEQAVDLGLADGLGNLDYVAREIVKAEDIIDYTRHENVAERLAKRFGAAIGEGAVRAMQTMPTVR